VNETTAVDEDRRGVSQRPWILMSARYKAVTGAHHCESYTNTVTYAHAVVAPHTAGEDIHSHAAWQRENGALRDHGQGALRAVRVSNSDCQQFWT